MNTIEELDYADVEVLVTSVCLDECPELTWYEFVPMEEIEWPIE